MPILYGTQINKSFKNINENDQLDTASSSTYKSLYFFKQTYMPSNDQLILEVDLNIRIGYMQCFYNKAQNYDLNVFDYPNDYIFTN